MTDKQTHKHINKYLVVGYLCLVKTYFPLTEKKLLETLILQVYHSGVGSRSARKGITIEKVKPL